MTVMPTVAAPSAPAAKPTGGAAASADAAEGVAAVFSAMVAAVSAELAASEHQSMLGVDVAVALDAATALPGEVDEVGHVDEAAQAAMAASVLGIVPPPPLSNTPEAAPDPATVAEASVPAATTSSRATDADVDTGRLDGLEPPADHQVAADAGAGPATAAVPEEGAQLPSDRGTTTGAHLDADAGTDEAAPATANPGAPTTDAEGPAERPVVAPAAAPVTSTDGAVAATAPAPAPAGPTAVDGPTAASLTDRSAAPSLPDQLVEVLSPLRRTPDGTHRMAIQLRPDELGDVDIEFQVRGNEISLSLRADLSSTNELLRESLAQLRAELDAAGFRSGTLDVTDHGDPRAQGDRSDRDDAAATRRPGDASADQTPTTAPPSAAAGDATRLDLRL